MNKLKFIICIFLGLTFLSCNEEEWLKEKPYSFNAPENSYETVVNFKQAVNYMFEMVRHWHFRYSDETGGWQHHLYIGSDVFYHGWPNNIDDNLNRYNTYIISTRNHVDRNWAVFYNVISNANTILEKLETNASQVPESAKLTFRAEALFFRAYYYSRLAHIWGGVPLVTEMLTAPRNDYVRATRDEVYEQCQLDLEEAVRLLADIDKVDDGAISKQLAQHLLAEVYISRGLATGSNEYYTKAIDAANAVVNHPEMGLMTDIFGSYANDDTKDVFYDLFRLNNTNRSRGNKEGLWVIQYDYLNGSQYVCNRARYIMPQLRTARVEGIPGTPNIGADGTHLPCPDFTMEDGGRGNGYFPTTHHFRKSVWGADFDNDIRNSEFNVFRDYLIDNVYAVGHGQYIIADGWLHEPDTFNFIYPAVTKFCGFEAIPDAGYERRDGAILTTSLGKQRVQNASDFAVGSFKDEYLIRLSETYLLLAEAYVRAGQNENAAAAINVVRKRANASDATADEMDIDYILDERIRELCGEEVRNITLFRMGKFVDRARKYSPCGHYVDNHQNLWPIPFNEIEKNIGAVLVQNPGY